MTGFDVPHHFPDDYVPVFGMDTTTTVAYYNDRFQLCALLPCVWPADVLVASSGRPPA